ncbi:hypothetical protein [Aquisphaera insulae]|uniref:hypothetical protein n=1 Tax=Aquisphaera insulae TaxID=2712864 RepID=UPI0013EA4C27|nr:hypothetical protein [Aquisphaera insulae]
MSTAGKVLIVLIVLATIGWMFLAAGVDELNRNANNTLVELEKKIEQLQLDVKTAQASVAKFKDQSTILQERIDREAAVLFSRHNDVQRIASKVRDELARVQYELSVVQEHAEGAKRSQGQRAEEVANETRNLAKDRETVEGLKAKDKELVDRLTQLRDQFKKTVTANTEALTRR